MLSSEMIWSGVAQPTGPPVPPSSHPHAGAVDAVVVDRVLAGAAVEYVALAAEDGGDDQVAALAAEDLVGTRIGVERVAAAVADQLVVAAVGAVAGSPASITSGPSPPISMSLPAFPVIFTLTDGGTSGSIRTSSLPPPALTTISESPVRRGRPRRRDRVLDGAAVAGEDPGAEVGDVQPPSVREIWRSSTPRSPWTTRLEPSRPLLRVTKGCRRAALVRGRRSSRPGSRCTCRCPGRQRLRRPRHRFPRCRCRRRRRAGWVRCRRRSRRPARADGVLETAEDVVAVAVLDPGGEVHLHAVARRAGEGDDVVGAGAAGDGVGAGVAADDVAVALAALGLVGAGTGEDACRCRSRRRAADRRRAAPSIRSFPAPPRMRSLPLSPSSLSLPLPPMISSLPWPL